MKLVFLGGDMRCRAAADYLKNCGFEIEFIHSPDDFSSLSRCDAVVLGVVAVDEYGKICGCDFNILYTDLVHMLPEKTPVIGGRLPSFAGHKCCDVLQREDFAVLNAALTAENAVMLAAQNTDFSLFHSEVLICGFGRIGKLLAHRLSLFGCGITCSLRKASDAAYCSAYGYDYIFSDEIKNTAHKYNIIFNTVPFTVITESVLERLNKDTVIIELASKPGGICRKKAEELGTEIIDGASLPGRFSPLSAGRIYGLTIENIMKEGVGYES